MDETAQDTHETGETTPREEEYRRPSFKRRLPGLLVSVVVLAGAIGVSAYWLMNRPKPDRRPPRKQATLVSVRAVRKMPHPVTITALGTVMGSRESRVAALVGGEVIRVRDGFVPGGRCRKGEVLVEVDPNDYILAVREASAMLDQLEAKVVEANSLVQQREAAITQARTQLRLERAQGQVARREYELLGEQMDPNDRALVLRVPQREAAEAAVDVARAAEASARAMLKAARSNRDAAGVALEKARLSLLRTEVRAPYNALVLERHVNRGGRVAGEGVVATITGIDEWWVEVSIPVNELKWLEIPGFNSQSASEAKVYYQAAWGSDPNAYRRARAAMLRGGLETKGRMAQLLVSVSDPLDLNRPAERRKPLLLGSYVRVDLVGRSTPPAVRVQRNALREGDRVWVMSEKGTLAIRTVTFALGTEEYVYVTEGLSDGELLVTSDIATPVEGMPLRRSGQSAGTNPEEGRDE